MSIRTGIAALVLAVVVAGCSAPQAGIPAREPTPSGPPLPPASLLPAAASPVGLAAIKACDLLTAQEASSLGMRPQGRAEEIIGLRRCDWTTPGGGGVSTGINEHRGIDGLNLADASSVTDVRIGRHQAKRALEGSGPGYCETIFAVGDNANVSVLTLYLDDTARACAVADRAAVLVESKLP
ncbi:MAG: DUF3558 family protein [Pseudonocardiaceae bacterium]